MFYCFPVFLFIKHFCGSKIYTVSFMNHTLTQQCQRIAINALKGVVIFLFDESRTHQHTQNNKQLYIFLCRCDKYPVFCGSCNPLTFQAVLLNVMTNSMNIVHIHGHTNTHLPLEEYPKRVWISKYERKSLSTTYCYTWLDVKLNCLRNKSV